MFFYIKPVWADPVWRYMIETVLLAAMTASAESVFHLAGLCASSCQNEVLQTSTVAVTAIEATLSICQFMCLSVCLSEIKMKAQDQRWVWSDWWLLSAHVII